MKKLDPDKERDYREEADRLAQLPLADQREIIDLHRSIASNPKVPKAERQAGLERAEALERFLGLKKPARMPAKARKQRKPGKQSSRLAHKR